MIPNVCPYVHLSVCLSVRMSICPYVHLSVCPYVHLSVCQVLGETQFSLSHIELELIYLCIFFILVLALNINKKSSLKEYLRIKMLFSPCMFLRKNRFSVLWIQIYVNYVAIYFNEMHIWGCIFLFLCVSLISTRIIRFKSNNTRVFFMHHQISI